MPAVQKFLQTLVEGGAIVQEDASSYEQRSLRRTLAEIRNSGEVDDADLVAALAIALHMRHAVGAELDVSESVRPLLVRFQPEAERMLPLYRQGGLLYVAVDDPFDVHLQERAESIFEEVVELVLASADEMSESIKRWSSGQERLTHVSRSLPEADEVSSSSIKAVQIDENSAPIVRLFNTILREAVARNASDIHIESQPKGTLIRCRVDGVLQPMMEPLESSYHDAIVTRIKVMAELDIAEHRLPQDGRFSDTISGGKVDFRVSILPGADKESVVVRVLDGHGVPGGTSTLQLDTLGLSGEVLRELRKAVLAPHGLVLVTGPTGSGKTTTLYAALNELDRDREKIITIEDPIEYRLPGILQIPVNEKKKVTFASGLRSILRHDPDKIMVGEIRDAETANIAVQSALTGHLVFTTVHANDSLDVLFRMTHMGIDTNSFVHALNCVLAQRLVRKLCPSCKRPVKHRDDLVIRYGVSSRYAEIPWQMADGCEHCGGSGYLGRTVIAELLRMTPALRESMKQYQAGQGGAMSLGEMTTLREAALALAKEGVTSFEEVMRVTGLD